MRVHDPIGTHSLCPIVTHQAYISIAHLPICILNYPTFNPSKRGYSASYTNWLHPRNKEDNFKECTLWWLHTPLRIIIYIYYTYTINIIYILHTYHITCRVKNQRKSQMNLSLTAQFLIRSKVCLNPPRKCCKIDLLYLDFSYQLLIGDLIYI